MKVVTSEVEAGAQVLEYERGDTASLIVVRIEESTDLPSVDVLTALLALQLRMARGMAKAEDQGADHFPSLLHHQSQGRQMEHHFKDLHRRHLPITSHPNRPCLLFHNLHSSKGSIPTFLHRLHHLHHQMCPSMVNLNTEHGLHHHRQCRT